ncbi:MAG: PAS domain S-box protein [Anaerolineae bacterium]
MRFNHACEQLTGYTADRVIGQYVWENLLEPGARDFAENFFKEFELSRFPTEARIGLLTSTGAIRTVQWINTFITVQDGTAFMIGSGQDVTEETHLRDELSETRLRVLFSQSPVGLFVSEVGMTHSITVNPAFERILGYTADELRTKDYKSYTFPDDIPTEEEFIAEMLAYKRDLYHLEKRYLHKDGRVIWGHFIAAVVRDNYGVPLYTIGILEDITERKHNEQILRSALRQLEMLLEENAQTEHLYHLIADNATDVIFVLNSDLTPVYISPSCYHVVGYHPQEILFLENFSLIHPDDLDTVRASITTLNSENTSTLLSSRVRRKTGVYIWLETRLQVLLNDDCTVKEIIGFARDISIRKEYEDALAQTNRELEAFTASVTHDLRAPLRSIEGFSQMLLQEHSASLSPDMTRYLTLIQNNAQHMNRLIKDLLELTRLGRQPLQKQHVDMISLALQTYASLDLGGRMIDFTVDDLPPARGDLGLLRVVFDNLLRNAVKFTSNREKAIIEIGYYKQQEEVVYWIKDNGVGFNMQYADKLFGVFQRLHDASEYEGNGIGLATVQRIIQRHGGRVWAQSEPDKGATFCFTLREG